MLLFSLCLHVLCIVSTQNSITTKYIKNPSLCVTKPCLCGLPGLIVIYFKCTFNIIITTTTTNTMVIIIIIIVLVHCTRVFEHIYSVCVCVCVIAYEKVKSLQTKHVLRAMSIIRRYRFLFFARFFIIIIIP